MTLFLGTPCNMRVLTCFIPWSLLVLDIITNTRLIILVLIHLISHPIPPPITLARERGCQPHLHRRHHHLPHHLPVFLTAQSLYPHLPPRSHAIKSLRIRVATITRCIVDRRAVDGAQKKQGPVVLGCHHQNGL